ncbi:MAG: Wzt carbohydrate-binding domain-containing protein [Candidatus Sumerlaeia bacterium]
MSIRVKDLSKRFRLYGRSWHRFQEWATLGMRSKHRDFWALRDINLDIGNGASVGIVGVNGAGKSTLLKLITGTLLPTEGEIRVQGRVAALLELGTGFHPEFTGRMNIFLNGKMLGLSEAEIEERLPEIIRFSELGDFIDQPLRTYSTGMEMRLGFSIATCVDPDVLIIDEVLSVGDAWFSQKCVSRIRQFREKGVTVLFVSHDPAAVLTLCDEAVLLDQGRLCRRGSPREILDYYNARIAQRPEKGASPILIQNRGDSEMAGQRSGNFRVLITRVQMRNDRDQVSNIFTSGEKVSIRVGILALYEVENPTVGIMIRNTLGVEIFGVNSQGLGLETGRMKPGQEGELCFEMDLNLGHGSYSLTTAVHLDESHLGENFDWIDQACLFDVLPSPQYAFQGIARLNPSIRMEAAAGKETDIAALLERVLGEAPRKIRPAAESRPFLLESCRLESDKIIMEEGARFVLKAEKGAIRLGLDRDSRATENVAAKEDTGLLLEWIGGNVRGRLMGKDALVFALPETLHGTTRMYRLGALPDDEATRRQCFPLTIKEIETVQWDA